MGSRTTIALLPVVLLTGSCFKLEYSGDELYACDPGEQPVSKQCPEGYQCLAAPAPLGPAPPQPELGRCHKTCTSSDQCATHPCVEGLCRPSDGPKPDMLTDGPPPFDGPKPPMWVCIGHQHIGQIPTDSTGPYPEDPVELVVQGPDDVVVVWVDEKKTLSVRKCSSGTWEQPFKPGSVAPINRVHAVMNDKLLVAFTHDPISPTGDTSDIDKCVFAPLSDASCLPTNLFSHQSGTVVGFDLDRRDVHTALVVVTAETSNNAHNAFFGILDDNDDFKENCQLGPFALAGAPRVIAGPTNVGSVWHNNPTKWGFKAYQGGDLIHGNASSPACASGAALDAVAPPTAAALAAAQGTTHTVFQRVDAQQLRAHHASGDMALVQPLGDAIVSKSSDITVLGNDPFISVIHEGPGPGPWFPAQVYGYDLNTQGFQALSRPTPEIPNDFQIPEGSVAPGPGELTRIVAAPMGPVKPPAVPRPTVHVLYDVHMQPLVPGDAGIPTAERHLFYFKCEFREGTN